MKCRVLMTVLTAAVLTGIFSPTLAQKNYYVVVGAFSTEGDADKFTTHLPSMNPDTAYAMHEQENAMHFYVLKTSNQEEALERTLHLQNAVESSSASLQRGNYESISVSNLPEGRNLTYKKGSHLANAIDPEAASAKAGGSAYGSSMAAPLKPMGKLFKFTISDDRGKTLPGYVHHVDLEKQRDLGSYTAHMYADILHPGKSRKDMAVVCGIFGYKEVEKFIDYENPSEADGAYRDENGAWVIPYELEPLEKGDVSVMYNVAFHKDAVIMMPQSQTDLDALVAMMKENPDMEITIHGHCNGKYSRKIIATDSANNFFDVNAVKEIHGSPKLLASLRAESVKSYLTQHDIDEKRVKIYSWGGNYMLVDAESPSAKLNDRIEIEIRKD